MEKILSVGNFDTPTIVYDSQTNSLSFIGRSVPENSYSFYETIKNWILVESNYQNENLCLIFHFELLSSSSLKHIHGIIQSIGLKTHLINTTIIWKYDKGDDDMRNIGMLLTQKSNIKFQFEEIDE
jgi:SiaC family regulatory phosphoprotein